MNLQRFQPVLFLLILGVGAVLVPARCAAQENSNPDSLETNMDVGGCADLPDFSRLPSSTIVSCDKGSSIEVTMPLKPDARGNAREKTVRGAYEFREYQIQEAELQDSAFDNLMQLLPIKGFDIKYSSSPSTITGHKQGVWILVTVSGESYNVKLVHVNEDRWTPAINARGILHEMEAHHRAAIYGITFSQDTQAIVEERSAILGEVLKFLQANPTLAFRVESHKMSNDGTAEEDLEITRKRANAVVAWFKSHGIAAAQLQPQADGRSKPLTDNDTPDEIQRNERIELAIAN